MDHRFPALICARDHCGHAPIHEYSNAASNALCSRREYFPLDDPRDCTQPKRIRNDEHNCAECGEQPSERAQALPKEEGEGKQ